MPRRPKVWFDYEYLASLDAENAPGEVFFLSEPAQQALSQLAEIVLWPTRWFNGDPDDSAALAASIYEELKVPAHFDDLIPLLDDVETLLQELVDKEDCCDTIDSVPGGDGIGGVDESTLPPDVDRDGESLPPEYEGDPEAYDAYLCGQAQAIADSTDDAVDAVHDTILAASNVIVFATLIILAFGNIIGMGIAAILAGGYTLVTISEIVGYYSAFTELRELLGGGDPGGLVAQTKGELAGIHDEIVAAIYCANDAAAAAGALHDLVDANVTSGSYAALLKLTYSIAMRPIFWGFGGADDSLTCPECIDPFDIDFTFTFDADAQGWTSQSCRAGWDPVNQCMTLGSGETICGFGHIIMNRSDLAAAAELDNDVDYEIVGIEVTLFRTGSGTRNFIIEINPQSGGQEQLFYDQAENIPASPTQYVLDSVGGRQFNSTEGGDVDLLHFYYSATAAQAVDVKVDNVRIKANVVTPA